MGDGEEIIRRLDRIIELLGGIDVNRRTGNKGSRSSSVALTDDERTRSKESTRELIAHYADEYKAKYGSFPVIDKKTAGLATNLLRSLSLERSRNLVSAFIQMDNAFFNRRSHNFADLVTNLNVVARALAEGTSKPGEKEFWKTVYGENDERKLRDTDQTPRNDLRREILSSYPGFDLLDGPKAPKR